jgi:ankyrin repeat protein
VSLALAAALLLGAPCGPSETPLLAAVHSGDVERVRALLASGADPDGCQDLGEGEASIPLELALWSKHRDIGVLLLDAGATPTPSSVQAAIVARDAELVEKLLAAGADANALVAGTPLLVHAVRSGDADVVEQLLAAGANPVGNAETMRVDEPAERRTVTAEAPEESLDVTPLVAVALPLLHVAASIYFREQAYAGEPENNGFATASSITTLGLLGALVVGVPSAAIVGANWGDGSWGSLGLAATAFCVGGAVGALGGGWVGWSGRDRAKSNAAWYYALEAPFVLVPVLYLTLS